MKIKYFLLALVMALSPMLAQTATYWNPHYSDNTMLVSTLDNTHSYVSENVTWVYYLNADVDANGATATVTACLNSGTTAATLAEAKTTDQSKYYVGDITLPNTVGGHTVSGIGYNYYTDPNAATNGINDVYTNWQSVTSVTFPATMTSIGAYTFSQNAVLSAVEFKSPGSWAHLTNIGYCAFNFLNTDFTLIIDGLDLSGLTSTTVGNAMFRGRAGVTGALKLPTVTTLIDNTAFAGTKFTSVNFTDLTQLVTVAFGALHGNSMASLDLSNCGSLTTIGGKCFDANPNLKSLTLPSVASLTIGYQAFSNCDLKGDLVIPSTGTTLGYNAFSNNSSLRSITFTGTSLDMGGYGVFSGCNGLEYIDMKSCVSITGVNSADATTLSRATSTAAGHMFAGLPTHTFVYLPNDGTVFNSTPGGGGLWDPSVEHWDIPNYATNGAAFLLLIEDGVDYFFPHPFKTDAVGYRDNSGNSTDYNLPTLTFQPGTTYSLYLPYDFTLPTGLGGYSPAYYNQHNPGSTTDNTFVFNKVSTFTANTPYLVRVEAGGAASTLPNIGSPKYEAGVTIQKIIPASPVGVNHNELATTVPGVNTISFNQTDINGTTAVNRPSVKDKNDVVWSLCGTSETVDAATAASWGAWYFATDNTWYPVKGDAYSYGLRQHRAFMIPSVPGATPSKGLLGGLLNGGETTGIGNVTNDNATSTHIYHMSGQYLGEDINSLPRGVYVVNGKKVVK